MTGLVVAPREVACPVCESPAPLPCVYVEGPLAGREARTPHLGRVSLALRCTELAVKAERASSPEVSGG